MMVRSRFPGRPSKIAQRNLVSAYSVDLPANDSNNIVEDMKYGYMVFQQLFGSNDEETPFHGFSPHEVARAMKKKKDFCAKANGKNKKIHSHKILHPKPRTLAVNNTNKGRLQDRRLSKLTLFNKFKPGRNYLSAREGLLSIQKQRGDKKRVVDFDKITTEKTTSSPKVLIREARLNLKCESTIQGPFSMPQTPPSSAEKKSRSPNPGVITCGICGVVKHYKYRMQTKKFGVFSCEPCRRFILKVIRDTETRAPELYECLKFPSGAKRNAILTSSQDIQNCFQDNRCSACWLFLCLMRYQMPPTLKKTLTNLLGENMKCLFSTIVADSKPVCQEGNFLNNGISSREDKIKRLSAINARRKLILDDAQASLEESATPLVPRVKNLENVSVYVSGPRIKHVCRSASSVLGTPLEIGVDDELVEKSRDKNGKCRLPNAKNGKNIEKNFKVSRRRNSFDLSETESNLLKVTDRQYGARNLQAYEAISSEEEDELEFKMISTDFWEAYDPDEVSKTGFAIIGSQSFTPKSLCYMCGSAGMEKLYYCVCCCEPYHWFCVDGGLAFRDDSELEKCFANWVCRKCTVCCKCGEGAFQKLLTCQRCRNSYHTGCLGETALNTKLFGADRPWVCLNCLKCKSCDGGSVVTYVGNLPLCHSCFKLRQKGNFCPLCQGCYEDDDYNVKMMECVDCKSWFHAKCEGISPDRYQILSFLPDTIEYVCRICCKDPPAQWLAAVEDTLKTGCLGVLKALFKDKKICDLLRAKPTSCPCTYPSDQEEILGREEDGKSASYLKFKAGGGDLPVGGSAILTQSDSGMSSMDDEKGLDGGKCCCGKDSVEMMNKSRLLEIKAKVVGNEYTTLYAFHKEVNDILEQVGKVYTVDAYRKIISQFFPWFDENHTMEEEEGEEYIKVREEMCITTHKRDYHVHKNEDGKDEFAVLRNLIRNDKESYDAMTRGDFRLCVLCKRMGEGECGVEGRLVYCGGDEWIHSNCALWSLEVFEEVDGSLQNVQGAVNRGRNNKCRGCGEKGASVGCWQRSCGANYHFTCARRAGCAFTADKSLFCPDHTGRVDGKLLMDEEEFQIFRPVYVETSLDRKKKGLACHTDVKMMIGSLSVNSLGRFDAHLSDTFRYIIPVDFHCSRLYWSSRRPWTMVRYNIRVREYYEEEAERLQRDDRNWTIDHSAADAKKISEEEDLLPLDLKKAIYEDVNEDLLLNDVSLREIWKDYMAQTEIKNGFRKRKTDLGIGGRKKCKFPEESDFRLFQLDGVVSMDDGEEPVTCEHCYRTYRTCNSYRRHLDTCSAHFGNYSPRSDSASEEEKSLVAAEQAQIVTYVLQEQPASNVPLLTDGDLLQVTLPHGNYLQQGSNPSNMCYLQSTTLQNSNLQQSVTLNGFSPTISGHLQGNFLQTAPSGYQFQSGMLSNVVNFPSVMCLPSAPVQLPQQNFTSNLIAFPGVQNVINLSSGVQTVPTMLGPVMESPTYVIQNVGQQALNICDGNVYVTPPDQAFVLGLETVVSNTVTSSRQLIADPIMGLVSGSHVYSTTRQISSDYSNYILVENAPANEIVYVETPIKVANPAVASPKKAAAPSQKLINSNGVRPIAVAPSTMANKVVGVVNPQYAEAMDGVKHLTGFVEKGAKTIREFVKIGESSLADCNWNVSKQSKVHVLEKPTKVEAKPIKCNEQTPKKIKSVPAKLPPSTSLDETIERVVRGKVEGEAAVKAGDSVQSLTKKIPRVSEETLLEPASPIREKSLKVYPSPKSKTKTFWPVMPNRVDSISPKKRDDSEILFDQLLESYKSSLEEAKKNEVIKADKTEEEKSCALFESVEEEKIPSPKDEKSENIADVCIGGKEMEEIAENNGEGVKMATSFDEEKENIFEHTTEFPAKTKEKRRWKTTHICFEVESEDGFTCKASNLSDLWNQVKEAVKRGRMVHKLPSLPRNAIGDDDNAAYALLGWENNATKYLLEQLPDAWKCVFYKPSYFPKNQQPEASPVKNPSGCARTEAADAAHCKYDMFSWLKSRHRKPPKFLPSKDAAAGNGNRGATNVNLPMAMRYRILLENSKKHKTVGVFRSDIHGRGLFCLRDIDQGEMVIEYAGQVIRSSLTDVREKYYTAKGIGCYMFRIDENHVVDATMSGNAARFINHSCEPNCYSKMVYINGTKHILIFALKRIPKGEELTYDYKFPREEEKIACHCLSRKCRKYLN